MANDIKLNAQARTEQGSGAVGRLRRAGILPAVLGNRGGGTTLIQLSAHEFTQMLRHHHADQLLVSLSLDGKEVPAIMREVQFNVLTNEPSHADFSEVSLTERIRVECAIKLIGEADGVKNGGGVLDQLLRVIHVECLPTEIVEHFDIDVSAMKLNDTLTVKDLNLGDKYRITTPVNVPVATIVLADAEIVTAAAATADAAAGGEPKVIAKGKKEDGTAPAGAAGAPAKK